MTSRTYTLASLSAVAVLLDLTHTCDPDYLTRYGVHLDAFTLVCPTSPHQAVDLLLDILLLLKLPPDCSIWWPLPLVRKHDGFLGVTFIQHGWQLLSHIISS